MVLSLAHWPHTPRHKTVASAYAGCLPGIATLASLVWRTGFSGCVVRQWHVTDAAARRWRRYQSLAAEASRAEAAAARGSLNSPAPAAEHGCAMSPAAPDGLNEPPEPGCAPSARRKAPNQAPAAYTSRASKRRRVECCLRGTGTVDPGAEAPCEVHDTVGAVCVGPRGTAP